MFSLRDAALSQTVTIPKHTSNAALSQTVTIPKHTSDAAVSQTVTIPQHTSNAALSQTVTIPQHTSNAALSQTVTIPQHTSDAALSQTVTIPQNTSPREGRSLKYDSDLNVSKISKVVWHLLCCQTLSASILHFAYFIHDCDVAEYFPVLFLLEYFQTTGC